MDAVIIGASTEHAGRASLRRLAMVLQSFGTVAFLIIFGVFLAKAQTWQGDDRVMVTVLAAFALSGLAYRMSRNVAGGRGIPVLIVALYLVELGNSAMFYLPNREEAARNIYLKHFDETKEIAGFLRKQPAPVRVWMNVEDVPFNFGDWYGIDVLNGFVPGVPSHVEQLEIHSERGRALYGAAYTVARKPVFPDQQEVFRDPNGLTVYENADVLPRVWTVHRAVTVKDFIDARRHLQDPAFDITKQTFLYAEPPAMDLCDGDSVRSFQRGINWAVAEVEMKCRGMVVMSENYAPGWIASVDGEPVPIYEAYTTLRGVITGPGTHRIEMHYQPISAIAGAAATLSAFISAFLLWIMPARSR
jgi:hypothetical protein